MDAAAYLTVMAISTSPAFARLVSSLFSGAQVTQSAVVIIVCAALTATLLLVHPFSLARAAIGIMSLVLFCLSFSSAAVVVASSLGALLIAYVGLRIMLLGNRWREDCVAEVVSVGNYFKAVVASPGMQRFAVSRGNMGMLLLLGIVLPIRFRPVQAVQNTIIGLVSAVYSIQQLLRQLPSLQFTALVPLVAAVILVVWLVRQTVTGAGWVGGEHD